MDGSISSMGEYNDECRYALQLFHNQQTCYQKLYNTAKGHVWFNALGYIDKDGNNAVAHLMDPVPSPEALVEKKRGDKKK